MTKPAVFGFYGKSNSGKTTIIVEIIKRLTAEGFKVATVKITNKNINIDTEEKDTWKYGKAGSELVIFSSPIETDYMHMKNTDFNKIFNYIKNQALYDIVLVEGARDKNIPKIRIGDIQKRENTQLTYEGDFKKVYKIIKNEISR